LSASNCDHLHLSLQARKFGVMAALPSHTVCLRWPERHAGDILSSLASPAP
jgi:hypothetical protein